jgi:hypothetical protein
MEAHELEQLPAASRRPAESRRPDGPGPLTMPAAVIGLQRLAGNQSVGALLEGEEAASPVREVVGSGGGAPLDPGARSFLEQRMGADFSDVRVHTGARADESARSISAQAYTVGTDVVFRSGAYEPDSPSGRHVLAHELAHVVQQKAGPVAGSPAPGGISVSDPSDAFEQAAVRTADQVMAAEPAPVAAAASGEAATAQRAAEDEEQDELAQTLPAQRAEEDEEEPAPEP